MSARYGAALATLVGIAACAAGGASAMPAVPQGFTIARIATVPSAREIAFAPNGDLFVGTGGNDVYVVPQAGDRPGRPHVFAHFDDAPAAGVAFASDTLYVGTHYGVWRIPYHAGDARARAPQRLASVRAPGEAQDHETTSVALRDGTLYAAVGSTCDACVETDPTRATIGRVENGTYAPVAVHIRNAIALTVNPNTGSLWAGVAGEDYLPIGHPYEIFDDVSSHAPPANYGWPYCYEAQRRNPVARWQGHDCGGTVVPRVVLPAYETPIGAAFYPRHARGKFSFAAQYAGGAFVTLHGSWHGPAQGLSGYVPPRVVFVPMNGDAPKRPVDWSDPSKQWTPFVTGYQEGSSIARSGRPTGIAVGPQGDLFIADDQTGAIYRVRPR